MCMLKIKPLSLVDMKPLSSLRQTDGIGMYSSLSRRTYENAMYELNSFSSPKTVDNFGYLMPLPFRDFTRSKGIGDLDLYDEIAERTGSDYKSVFYKFNRFGYPVIK